VNLIAQQKYQIQTLIAAKLRFSSAKDSKAKLSGPKAKACLNKHKQKTTPNTIKQKKNHPV
jgi:hypothetical protein